MQTKEKEIDVWVHRDLAKDNKLCSFETVYKVKPDSPYWVEAKLIIEIPERRKEFTESEFVDAFESIFGYDNRSYKAAMIKR
jgi:hypothetical protein